MTTYLLAAINELVLTLFREILFAEELLAMVEVVGRRIFVVAGCDPRETIAHASDLVRETF
jgi:hypothetical protein